MGATKAQIEWLRNLPEYKDMVKVMGVYDDSIDYVGAEGDWKSRFIPRTLWLIDINVCAYIHDYWYKIGGKRTDKIKADGLFLVDMIRWINEYPDKWYLYGANWLRKVSARRRALKYYEAVYAKGDAAFNYNYKEDS